MIVRIITEHGEHDNFYEGERIGFHEGFREPDIEVEKGKEYLEMIVESEKSSVSIQIEKNKKTKIFVMNDNGKTIERLYV